MTVMLIIMHTCGWNTLYNSIISFYFDYHKIFTGIYYRVLYNYVVLTITSGGKLSQSTLACPSLFLPQPLHVLPLNPNDRMYLRFPTVTLVITWNNFVCTLSGCVNKILICIVMTK